MDVPPGFSRDTVNSRRLGCEHCSAVSVFVLLPRLTDSSANLPDVLDIRNDFVTGDERHEQI